MPNLVVHFEIMDDDAAKTPSYYADLFAWRIDTNNPFAYDIAYTRESGESGIYGGLGSADRGNPRASVFAQVDDPQPYLGKAVALGHGSAQVSDDGNVLRPRWQVHGPVQEIRLQLRK